MDQAHLCRVRLPSCGKSHLFQNESSLAYLQVSFSLCSFNRRIRLWCQCVLAEVDFEYEFALPLPTILGGVQHVLSKREIIYFKILDFSRKLLVGLEYSKAFILRFVDLSVRRDLQINLEIGKECKVLAEHKFLV